MTSAGRDTVAAIAGEREPRLYRECVYCGAPSYGLACSSHRDLLFSDPHQYSMRLRSNVVTDAGTAQEGATRT